MVFSVIIFIRNSFNGAWYSFPNTTTGKLRIVLVCISVQVSKNSSMVPNPPGMTMNPNEYFSSNTFLTKKYRIVTHLCIYGFGSCSNGRKILQPTDLPPFSNDPLFAASINPGPPPVITVPPIFAIDLPNSYAFL